MNKLDKVIIRPISYPCEKWIGIVLSKRTHKSSIIKYRVKYDCHGITFTDSFYEKELIKMV